MLVLSRHRDQAIIIGDDISVMVVDIRGDKVRLGITAPENVPVHRLEVYEAIQRENRKHRKAAGESPPVQPKKDLAESLLDWAVSRWIAEVKDRPLQNVNRRPLDDTWRQVIRQLGGDDVALCGPRHDQLGGAA